MSATQERIDLKSYDVIPYVREYNERHITKDGKYLEIELAGQNFPLELRNVGDDTHPIYIAWLDTHPDHEGVPIGLPHAAALERANLILKMVREHGQEVSTIVTPNSAKSIPSIQETVDILSHSLKKHINLIILPGGKNEDDVVKQSAISPVMYHNVTSPDAKYLGITQSDINLLLKNNIHGKGLLTMDDVYTSGNTDETVQEILNLVLHLPDTIRHPLICIARESEYFGQYPQAAPHHVFAPIYLPEFTHGFHN